MDEYEVRIEIGGKTLSIQTGKLAKQANGSCLIRYGDSVLLTAATASREPRESIDYFPLTVDFEEKLYAAGKIPGGFIKREGRPSEFATVTARLIDRPTRPLFPENYFNDVQVVCTSLSSDLENPMDVLGIVGASTALSISDIPFGGPIAGVRVGMEEGRFIVNPTYQQINSGGLNLVVAGTEDAVMMVECGANHVGEKLILDAIEYGCEAIRGIIDAQLKLVERAGRPKQKVEEKTAPAEIEEEVRRLAEERLRDALTDRTKTEREDMIAALRKDVEERLGERYEENARHVASVMERLEKRIVRENIISRGARPDGRKPEEIRPISCEAGILPRTHGSALFTRGQTQVLNIVTLGTISEEQRINGITAAEHKRFIHQYSFPPYSVGETKPMRGPSRRDVGHGALAEKALIPNLPLEEEFPYTIRSVSEVLESNGSSSMASVCAASMALMDAGVPVKNTIAGIAMGLIIEDGKHFILTDIQGIEDHDGDMDFKVAGSRDGVSALQMDIKVKGITGEIMREALERAREARLFIMDKMEKAVSRPRPELSKYAPRIIQLQISVEKIGDVIGPGGKTIRKITEETGTKIDIMDDGKIYIYSPDKAGGEEALRRVKLLVEDLEPGKVYDGVVTRVMSFGAVVEMLPGKDGLVHISQIADRRVEKVEDYLRVGQKVRVRVRDIDDYGKVSLTMKNVR
ncbi:MAG: polyribonucleotide nucleotidyltransferase [bacterium]